MNAAEQLFTSYVEGLGRNLEIASVFFAGTCRICQRQRDALQTASAQCGQFEAGLGQQDAASGGVTALSGLLGLQMEAAMAYWGDVGQEWMAVQSEVGKHLQQYGGEWADIVCKQAEMVQLGSPLDTSFFLSPAWEPLTSFVFPRMEPAVADAGARKAH